jgi:NAD(P)-dependent dehydrogenase (short-subunit alcohol dehydrogenase family)
VLTSLVQGIAEAFALAGAKAIIITARKVEALKDAEAVIKKANPSVEVLPVALEITDESSVEAAFKKIAESYPTIDILVNNAGLFASDGQFLGSADISKWWADFEVNVKGTVLVTRDFLSQLKPGQPAHIVYLTSGAGLATLPGGSAYGITKLADIRLAAYVAAEHPHVRVTALHPGIVHTEMASEFFVPYAKDTPALPGSVVNWLTSEEAAFLRGRYITANWDVNELIARKEEIVEKDLLTVQLSGLTGQVAQVKA